MPQGGNLDQRDTGEGPEDQILVFWPHSQLLQEAVVNGSSADVAAGAGASGTFPEAVASSVMHLYLISSLQPHFPFPFTLFL